jgi:hypothetical protein
MKKKYPKLVGQKLTNAIEKFKSVSYLFLKDPAKDFTRERKITLNDLIRFLLSIGGNSISKELLDYYQYNADTATTSAFIQQREKLNYEGLGFIANEFINSFKNMNTFRGYRLIGIDGSDVNIPFNPRHPETFIAKVNSRGSNSIHLNAFYDLLNKVYLDSVIQTAHCKNEFRAATDMIDRSKLENAILLFDRGYESYNVIAHIEQKGFQYLIRIQEPNTGSGILKKLNLPDNEELDIQVSLKISRKQTNALKKDKQYRLVHKKSTFDFLEQKSEEIYPMSFRIVGVEIKKDLFQYFVTNLDPEEFDKTRIGELYRLRWGVETSFRELKYVLGLTAFHSKKIDLIKQEIYAKLIMYNFCELITLHVVITQKPRKYTYQVNFTMAIHICKRYFLKLFDKDPPNIEALILRYILPIRTGRNYPRNIKSQSSVSFIYRVA